MWLQRGCLCSNGTDSLRPTDSLSVPGCFGLLLFVLTLVALASGEGPDARQWLAAVFTDLTGVVSLISIDSPANHLLSGPIMVLLQPENVKSVTFAFSASENAFFRGQTEGGFSLLNRGLNNVLQTSAWQIALEILADYETDTLEYRAGEAEVRITQGGSLSEEGGNLCTASRGPEWGQKAGLNIHLSKTRAGNSVEEFPALVWIWKTGFLSLDWVPLNFSHAVPERIGGSGGSHAEREEQVRIAAIPLRTEATTRRFSHSSLASASSPASLGMVGLSA